MESSASSEIKPLMSSTSEPLQTKQSKDNHGVTVAAVAIFVLLSLSSVAFLYYQNQQLKNMLIKYQTPVSFPTPTVAADPTEDWKTYTHSTEKYQFKYPPEWTAVKSQGASAESLFGPNATSKTGIGGVEVRELEVDPKNFLNSAEIEVISQTPLTINGISGYKNIYKGITNGVSFVFKHKNDLIYNVYINSNDSEDLKLFELLLSTFKFESSDTITEEKAASLVSSLPEVKNYLSSVTNGKVSLSTDGSTSSFWLVHVYEDLDDHLATFAWYQVDKTTGKVTKKN